MSAAKRPVVTIHLPVEASLTTDVMRAVAKRFPGAVVASGRAETTTADGTTYETREGHAMVLLAEAEL